MSPSHVSSFTTADTVDSFSFFYSEIGQFFETVKSALLIAGMFLGGKYLFRLGFHSVKFLHAYYVGPLIFDTPDYRKENGKWAIIFGGTEDLGKDFIGFLALYGMHILLIGDNEMQLRQMTKRIREDFLVKADYVCLDVCEPVSQFTRVSTTLMSKEIAILVNNWGSPRLPCADFTSQPTLFSNIEIKLAYMVMLNRWIVRSMVNAGRGAIITVTCSEADCDGLTYGPELKYIHAFVENQVDELSKYGLMVQLFQPFRGAIILNGDWLAKYDTSLIVPNSRWYVHRAMKIVGLSNSTSGYWSHSIFAGVWSLVPGWCRPKFHAGTMRILQKYQAKLPTIPSSIV